MLLTIALLGLIYAQKGKRTGLKLLLRFFKNKVFINQFKEVMHIEIMKELWANQAVRTK